MREAQYGPGLPVPLQMEPEPVAPLQGVFRDPVHVPRGDLPLPRPGSTTAPPSRGSSTSTPVHQAPSPSTVATTGQTVSMGTGSRTRKCRMRVLPWVWLLPCSTEPPGDTRVARSPIVCTTKAGSP